MSHFYLIREDGGTVFLPEVTTPAQAKKFEALTEGIVVASVTTKADLLPGGMSFWRQKEIHRLAQANPEWDFDKCSEAAWGYRTSPSGEILTSSAFGDRCHKALEEECMRYSFGMDHEEDEGWEKYTLPWREFMEKESIEVVECESVYSDADCYRTAGRIDMVGKTSDGKIALFDFKTRQGKGKLSTKTYPKDCVQLALLAELYSNARDISYQIPTYSVVVDTDTAELFVKRWTPVAQYKGLQKFMSVSIFYDTINGMMENQLQVMRPLD